MDQLKTALKASPLWPILNPGLAPYRATRRSYRRATKKRRLRKAFTRELRPTDLFIVGHPKSGNTWLAYMLAVLLRENGGDGVTLANIGQFVPVLHGCDREIRNFRELPDPRVFRNEEPLYPKYYPRTVYLYRDPRAVLLSYYHHYRVYCNDTETTLEDFVDEYLHNGCIERWEPGIERWDRQVTQWISRARRDRRVIAVSYEEMVDGRRAVLERISDFASFARSQGDLGRAVTRGEFQTMRRLEERQGAESYPGETGRRGRFIRRGKVHGWRDEMDERVAERITTEFREAMQLAGYLN